MSSATQQVLGTYKLLEAILRNCQVRQLFVLQSVSSAWCTVIERSEALRKKMFLLADGKALDSARVTDLDAPEYDACLLLSPAFHMQDTDCSHITYVQCEGQGRVKGAMYTGVQFQQGINGTHLLIKIGPKDNTTGIGWPDILLTQPPI